jgi:uncharacterized PurR-regulated membrane protein YhhQ (DUF165 family)
VRIQPFCFRVQLFQHLLVAKMQAVKVANGYDTVLVFFLAVVQAADDLHVELTGLTLKRAYPTRYDVIADRYGRFISLI